jgi:hypothetical protein
VYLSILIRLSTDMEIEVNSEAVHLGQESLKPVSVTIFSVIQSPVLLTVSNLSALISSSSLYLFCASYHKMNFIINVIDQGLMHNGSNIYCCIRKHPPRARPVAHTCKFSYLGGRDRRIAVLCQPRW